MADFNQNLNSILNAVYGKDVRRAIYDALVYLGNNQGTGTGSGSVSVGNYTLPVASANTLGGIKISSDFSITSDGKMSIADNKVVRKGGYTDNDIGTFLFIDSNKNVVPVPIRGQLFDFAYDDNGKFAGLEFSTTGRLWLTTFIGTILNNSNTGVAGVYYTPSISDITGGFRITFTPSDPDMEIIQKDIVYSQNTGSTGDGTPGGYYIPVVQQLNADTLEISFTPSDPDMPDVDPIQMALPAGKTGAYYKPSVTSTATGFELTFTPTDKTLATISTNLLYPTSIRSPFFDVREYGAKGDGTTDDWTAIQNALNAARDAGGGVVYLPKAVYLVNGSGSLTIYENTILYGEPEATLKAGSSRNNIIKNKVENKSSDPVTDGGYSQASNIKILNITFDCNGESYPTRGSNPVAFGHCQNIVIKNCKFTNCRVDNTNSAPHYMDLGGVKNILIDGCVFDEVKAKTENADYVQLDCVIKTAWGGDDDSKCYHDGTICRDVTIQNCKFYGNTNSSYTPTVAIGCCHTYESAYMPQGVYIKNNEFYNTWANSVSGSSPVNKNRACIFCHAGKYYTICNNTWYDDKYYDDSTTTAIHLNNKHLTNVVKNNTFYNTKYPIAYTSAWNALEFRSASGNTHIAYQEGASGFGTVLDDVNYSSISSWTGGSY